MSSRQETEMRLAIQRKRTAAVDPPPRPVSMAAPPDLGTAAVELGDSMVESVKKTAGDYWRGAQNIGTYAAEPLLTDVYIDKVRARLRTEQAEADAQFKPYEEAHPLSTLIAPGMLALTPAGRTLKGAALSGAALEGGKYSENQALAAAEGAVGGMAGFQIGKQFSKGFDRSDDAQLLVDGGVEDLTVGEQLGGAWQFMEDKLASLPFLDYAIGRAKYRSAEGFSRSRVNAALKQLRTSPDVPQGPGTNSDLMPNTTDLDLPQIGPDGRIGDVKVPDEVPSGGDAMAWADARISQEYQSVLSDMPVKVDQQFYDEYTKVLDMSNNLSPAGKAEFDAALAEHLHPNFANETQTMLGETFRESNTGLRDLAKNMMSKGQSAPMQRAGKALKEIQESLKRAAIRQNPERGDRFKAVEKAFAKMRVNEKAAQNVGSTVGDVGQVFNGSNYLQAVKKSTDPRAFSHGSGFDQKLAEASRRVQVQKVNNSGTNDRMLFSQGLLGGTFIDPMIGGGIGGSALMYTKPMQKGISKLMFDRPQNSAWQALQDSQILERGGAALGAHYLPSLLE